MTVATQVMVVKTKDMKKQHYSWLLKIKVLE